LFTVIDSAMNIINPIISGAVRSIKSIKGVLAIWITTLLLVSMVAIPLKSSVNSILGRSMITEKLKDGINVDVLTDFGTNLKTIMASFSKGFLLLILCGILINVFFNGGLFTTLRNNEEKYSSAQFFRGAGLHFWPFLLITFILSFVMFIIISLAFGITMMISGGGNPMQEGGMANTVLIGGIISALILPVFLLVADYARVWQAKSSKSAAIKAIGIGFNQTFRYFFSSYPIMLINIFIQVLFSWFMLKFISGYGPQTGGGVFLLFLFSQFLYIIKILLRVWRYGSVTSMFEKHPE
jgi:hypothetical protein